LSSGFGYSKPNNLHPFQKPRKFNHSKQRVKSVKEENYDEKSIEVNTDFNVQEVNNTIKTSCGTWCVTESLNNVEDEVFLLFWLELISLQFRFFPFISFSHILDLLPQGCYESPYRLILIDVCFLFLTDSLMYV